MASDDNALYQISKRVAQEMGGILGVRVYISVLDPQGRILITDSAYDEELTNFLFNFVSKNYQFLDYGDHSFPISGKNLAIFRLSNSVLTLFTLKGHLGQLLAFKSKIDKYDIMIKPHMAGVSPVTQTLAVEDAPAPDTPSLKDQVSGLLDDLISEKTQTQTQTQSTEVQSTAAEAAPAPAPRLSTKKVQRVPKLIRDLTSKDKFPIEEIQVLQACDGYRNFKEISEKTDIPQLRVEELVKKYTKKGLLKLKRIFR